MQIGRGIVAASAAMGLLFALVCAACSAHAAPVAAHCVAVDGDTLRCGEERVRLLGIDAPELPGHCARYRRCAPGDPFASRRALAALIRTGPVTLHRTGHDRYGRTLAVAFDSGTDLSCAQLAAGHAIYKRSWDDGGLVAHDCPSLAR